MFIICLKEATDQEILRDLIYNYGSDCGHSQNDPIWRTYLSRDKAEEDLNGTGPFWEVGDQKKLKDQGYVIKKVNISTED